MIQIRIPNYLRQIQTSKSRRAKYFENDNPDRYPKKYQNNKRYAFKNGRLYDFDKKEFVVANEGVLKKPRFVPVNGNVILRMHKDVLWGKVMPALDDMFTTALVVQLPRREAMKIPFPWKISLEFCTHYGFADWDIDNPWIYEKCFNDALKRHLGFDDSILKITNGGEKRFRPIRSHEDRELKIIIETDKDFAWPHTTEVIKLEEFTTGKAGDLTYNYNPGFAAIHVGKKRSFGKAQQAIRKLMFKCLNDMVPVSVPKELYDRYHMFFKDFNKYNVKIIITP